MKMPHLSMDSFFFSGKNLNAGNQPSHRYFLRLRSTGGFPVTSHQIHQRRPGAALGERAESAWEAQGMWLAVELRSWDVGLEKWLGLNSSWGKAEERTKSFFSKKSHSEEKSDNWVSHYWQLEISQNGVWSQTFGSHSAVSINHGNWWLKWGKPKHYIPPGFPKRRTTQKDAEECETRML